jgi:predicted Abi (CAAX) family protease
MPGFGALNAQLRHGNSEKRVHTITLSIPKKGGQQEWVAEHLHSHPHGPESHKFQSAGELAAHVTQALSALEITHAAKANHASEDTGDGARSSDMDRR